jgi:hypothetical protein
MNAEDLSLTLGLTQIILNPREILSSLKWTLRMSSTDVIPNRSVMLLLVLRRALYTYLYLAWKLINILEYYLHLLYQQVPIGEQVSLQVWQTHLHTGQMSVKEW